jgi:hypothetical protein
VTQIASACEGAERPPLLTHAWYQAII